MATLYIPIWRDYELTMSATPEDYIVNEGATPIYTGRAYARPGELYPKVRVNDIAAPYLSNPFPLGSDFLSETTAIHAVTSLVDTFQVYESDGVTPIGDALVFAYDWSGEGDVGSVVPMQTATGHRPIVQKVAMRQPIILTLFNDAPVLADAGDISVRSVSTDATVLTYSTPGNYVLGDDEWPDDAELETWIAFGPLIFDTIPHCKVRYVLYYVNAHGCWDSLPLEGKCRTAVDYERKELKRVYDNSDKLTRGTVNYLNGQTRRWTLRTGWVDAVGVSRMPHLIGSPSVYLMDLTEQRTWPVVISDTSVEERQYDDELAPVIYTINVKAAREGERR